MTYLATITKVAEVEVEYDDALNWLINEGSWSEAELRIMDSVEVIEIYVSMAEEELDVEYEQLVKAVTTFPAALRKMGYTEEDLEESNPYTQWSHEL